MSRLRRLWNAFRSGRVRRDIDREISFHLAERTDQLRSEGLTDEEAAHRARRQFGNVTLQTERTRDADIALWADALLRNLRLAIRTLARTPGFTVTVVLTLALGIGANAAVFSAVNAVLVQPLAFPDSDRLMQLGQTQERTAEDNIAPVRLADWDRLNSTFEAISGYYIEDASEMSGEFPERTRRASVAPRFLEVWGVPPVLGRDFTDAEHKVGGPPAVLISHGYWLRRFGADADAVGKAVRIDRGSYPIVGVMPASFVFPERDVDLWFPSPVDATYAQSRRNAWYTGVGRLKRDVTVEQARADLKLVQAQLADQYPDTDRKIGVVIEPLKEITVGGIRSSLWLLFGAVCVLLLITCTNIASLLISRATHRQQEIAVRLSLGATRSAVAAQTLTEVGVLAFLGGTIGLLLASGASALLRVAAAELPRIEEISTDGTILLYTLCTTLIVTLLCGVLPAMRAARHGIAAATNEAGRAQVSTRNSLQWVLVSTQVTLSVVLLAGAGLLVRSFEELSRVNPGFNPRHVLTFRVSGDWSETMNYDRLKQRIGTTIGELSAIPGVEAVATTGWSLPGVPTTFPTAFELAESREEPDRRIVAEARSVSPDYFATMQIPLITGELCRSAVREVMVNRAFVRRYLPDRAASGVGLHLAQIDSTSPPSRIVGIVGDAREQGLDHHPGPTVYSCASAPNPTPYFLVRTSVEPGAIATTIRLKMKAIEPLRAVYDVAPLEEQIGEAFSQNRLRTIVLALFAMTALFLACLGLYGTLSYVVSLRRREIGLRLALGAVRNDIIRQFLGQGLRVAGLACSAGLVLSAALTRLLSGMLYGVTPTDPVTLSAAVGLVLVVAAAAASVPAIRAALLEPMQVLRQE